MQDEPKKSPVQTGWDTLDDSDRAGQVEWMQSSDPANILVTMKGLRSLRLAIALAPEIHNFWRLQNLNWDPEKI